MVENRDGEDSERGSIDTELGFTKWGNEWVLATRRAFYDNTQYGNVYSFVRASTSLRSSRPSRLQPRRLSGRSKTQRSWWLAVMMHQKPRVVTLWCRFGQQDAYGHRGPRRTATTQRIEVSVSFRSALGSAQGVFISCARHRHEPQPLRLRSEPARPFAMTGTYGAIYAQGL